MEQDGFEEFMDAGAANKDDDFTEFETAATPVSPAPVNLWQ